MCIGLSAARTHPPGVFKSMKISRRDFLKTTALTSLYFAGFGTPTYATGTKKNLVIIMLRGGMDGLCAIPVKGDKNFEKLRSKINLDRTLGILFFKSKTNI